MSEEVKVDAPPAEEVKTETNGEAVKAEEEKPAAAPEKDASTLSEEDREALGAKVAKQIYFYFSDSNLPIDRYFFTLTTCNKEGWVPIETILTFKRMREFQPYGVPFVVEALKKVIESEGNDPLVAVDEEAGNVRRKRPLEAQTDAWARSVYVKGFGAGETDKNSQEQLESWFQQFGSINAVRKRREDIDGQGFKGKGKGDFKGSVFAEFAYEKDMKAFLEAEEPKKFTDDSEEELVKMTKGAYVEMKAKEKGIPQTEIQRGGGKDKSSAKWNAFREMNKIKSGGAPALAKIPDGVKVVGAPMGGQRERDNGKKRSRDDDDEEGASKRERVEETSTFTLNYKGKDLECDKATGKVLDRAQLEFPAEAVVQFQGGTDNPDWKDLKVKIIEQGFEKPFMAFPPGATSGSLAKQDDAEITEADLTKLNEAKLQFGGADCVFTRMSEDEQRSFWHTRANWQGKLASAKFSAEAKPERKQFDKGGRGGGGRGGGGRGGRGRGGGRGGGRGRGGRGGGRDGGNRDRNQEKAAGMPPSVGTA